VALISLGATVIVRILGVLFELGVHIWLRNVRKRRRTEEHW
jgi:hypothetical protein